MKNETRFDPDAELIVVNATIRGPRGSAVVRLAIDTGSAATVIVPDVLDEIGYSARDGTARTSVTTAVAPLCWENRVFLTTVSGADSITQLPHQGYIFRTQPNSRLQPPRPLRRRSSPRARS